MSQGVKELRLGVLRGQGGVRGVSGGQGVEFRGSQGFKVDVQASRGIQGSRGRSHVSQRMNGDI